MKGVQCYELFGGIALEDYAFLSHFFTLLFTGSYCSSHDNWILSTTNNLMVKPFCYSVRSATSFAKAMNNCHKDMASIIAIHTDRPQNYYVEGETVIISGLELINIMSAHGKAQKSTKCVRACVCVDKLTY